MHLFINGSILGYVYSLTDQTGKIKKKKKKKTLEERSKGNWSYGSSRLKVTQV